MSIEYWYYIFGLITVPAFKLAMFVIYLIRVGIRDAGYYRNPVKGFFKSMWRAFIDWTCGCIRVL